MSSSVGVKSHPEENEHPIKRHLDPLFYVLLNGYHTQSLLQVVGPTMNAIFFCYHFDECDAIGS